MQARGARMWARLQRRLGNTLAVGASALAGGQADSPLT